MFHQKKNRYIHSSNLIRPRLIKVLEDGPYVEIG